MAPGALRSAAMRGPSVSISSCSASSRRRSAARGPRTRGPLPPMWTGRRGSAAASATARSGRSRRARRGSRPRRSAQIAFIAWTRSRIRRWRRRRVGAVVAHLRLVPAGADAEHEAPAGQRGRGRRPASPARSGRARSPAHTPVPIVRRAVARGSERERDERVVRAAVACRGSGPPSPVDHARVDGDVRVLGRRTATRSRAPRPRGPARRVDAVSRQEDREPDHHAATGCRRPRRAGVTSRWRIPNASREARTPCACGSRRALRPALQRATRSSARSAGRRR